MIFKGESKCRALALYFHFRALLMPLCQCPSVNGEDYNGRKKGASFFYMQHNFCDSINTSGAVGNKRLKN